MLLSLACSALFLSLATSSPVASREIATTASSSLAELALQQILDTASPIFGIYDYNATAPSTSTWMKHYPDSTQLIHMNIPGTHDSSTWNYSQATQNSLLHITAVDGVVPAPAAIYRCQEKSYFDMLNDGIRAFDIRYSFDATNSSLVVYHSAALQSETALLEDIMFGFYQWLEEHPSETLLLSFSELNQALSVAVFERSLGLSGYSIDLRTSFLFLGSPGTFSCPIYKKYLGLLSHYGVTY